MVKLVTHNGSFHYDEILATAVLLKIYPEAEIVRTRDENEISSGDIIYDVGRVFDPSKNRYDHHQNTFNETYSSRYDIKLSSAGLIYKYFHKQLFELYSVDVSSEIYDFIVEKIYSEFFLSADAIDNGVNIFGKIKARTVADLVGGFNSYNSLKNPKENETTRFFSALKIVQIDLDNYLDYIFNDYCKKFKTFYEEIKKFEGDILVCKESVSSDLLFDINKLLNKDLKFAIVESSPSDFRILTFKVEKSSFAIKYPLHADWRGLANEKLSEVAGIEGCIFCHATGFTGGNKTLEGAIKMCEKSIEYLKSQNMIKN